MNKVCFGGAELRDVFVSSAGAIDCETCRGLALRDAPLRLSPLGCLPVYPGQEGFDGLALGVPGRIDGEVRLT